MYKTQNIIKLTPEEVIKSEMPLLDRFVSPEQLYSLVISKDKYYSLRASSSTHKYL